MPFLPHDQALFDFRDLVQPSYFELHELSDPQGPVEQLIWSLDGDGVPPLLEEELQDLDDIAS